MQTLQARGRNLVPRDFSGEAAHAEPRRSAAAPCWLAAAPLAARTPCPGTLLRQLEEFIPIPTQESLTRPVPLVTVTWDFNKMSPLIITKA